MINWVRRSVRREAGAVAVEFAFVVPVLLVLLFGIISYGILFSQQLALNNGVRQGARLAVVEGSTPAMKSCGGVATEVQNATGPAIGMDTDDIDVTVLRTSSDPCGTGDPTTVVCTNSIDSATNVQQSIIVTANYQASLLLPIPVPGLPRSFDLQSRAVYKCEFN